MKKEELTNEKEEQNNAENNGDKEIRSITAAHHSKRLDPPGAPSAPRGVPHSTLTHTHTTKSITYPRALLAQLPGGGRPLGMHGPRTLVVFQPFPPPPSPPSKQCSRHNHKK